MPKWIDTEQHAKLLRVAGDDRVKALLATLESGVERQRHVVALMVQAVFLLANDKADLKTSTMTPEMTEAGAYVQCAVCGVSWDRSDKQAA